MSRLVLYPFDTIVSTVASQAKVENLTSMAVQARVRVDEFRATNPAFTRVVRSVGKGVQWRFLRDSDGFSGSRLYTTGGGDYFGSTFDFATLPADGNDVVMYWDYISGSTANFAIGSPGGGTVYVDSTHGSSLAALPTGSGTGDLWIQDGCYDCVAVFNARRTGAARFTKPESTDSDVVSLYYFAEGSGTTTADAKGGNNMVLNGATWTTGGTWNADAASIPIAAISAGHHIRSLNR